MLEKDAEKYLDFKEFCTEVKKLLSGRFDEECKIELNQVTKNNAIKLEGIVILQKNETVAPNIYLNNYYMGYRDGLGLEEIIQNIYDEYHNARMQGDMKNISENLEVDKVKSSIIYRLINYNKNKDLLGQIPHTKFLDLAVTFHCLVRSNEEGIGTIRITNQHLKIWNITLEDLIQHARINTPKLFPPVVQSMKKVIKRLMEEDRELHRETFYERNSIEKDMIEDFTEEEFMRGSHQDNNMLVVSNHRNINGASCMIYPDLIKEISEQLDSDLYILPSSIHELIIVKNDYSYDKKILKEMVKDINFTQVPLEEVLSNNIYFYSRSRLAITQL